MTRGCGCLGLVLIGIFCCGFIMGAMMGDYGGPPEGIAEDRRVKAEMMLSSTLGIVACWFVGWWLASGDHRRDG